MGILKSKIRSWNLPQLLLIIALLLLMRTMINSWYNHFIVFLIKSSLRNVKRKKMWK
jgi:hypothetical protein